MAMIEYTFHWNHHIIKPFFQLDINIAPLFVLSFISSFLSIMELWVGPYLPNAQALLWKKSTFDKLITVWFSRKWRDWKCFHYDMVSTPSAQWIFENIKIEASIMIIYNSFDLDFVQLSNPFIIEVQLIFVRATTKVAFW